MCSTIPAFYLCQHDYSKGSLPTSFYIGITKSHEHIYCTLKQMYMKENSY